MIQVIRTEELWQRAGVYYVRTQAMVKGFDIPLEGEFDDRDTPDTKYILILDGVVPIAACRVRFTESGEGKIERVCVLEEYRGRGIGRTLIRAGEEWLEELGAAKIIITSRKEAAGFYEALGYQADYKNIVKGGVFDIVYTEKNLTAAPGQ